MHVRLVLTYFNPQSGKTYKDWHFLPKEAHIDGYGFSRESHLAVIEDCCSIVEKQHDKIMKMLPNHLKNKDFEVIIHGEYMRGYDHQQGPDFEQWVANVRWSNGEPIFNITQLELPEKDRPLIKTS